MKHLFRLLILAGVVLLAWWAWTVLTSTPQSEIRHRLNNLAKAASFPADEGKITGLMKARKLGDFFSEQVEVRLEAPGYPTLEFNSRDELIQATSIARTSVRGLKAAFPDMRIEVTSGNQAAIVDLTLDADVGGEKSAIVQEMKLNLKKVDGTWLITHVETVKTLK